MKILITGGAGYIGNILTPYLLNIGYEVTVLDNLIHRQHGILENCTYENFQFIYGDVRDRTLYGKLIAEHDAIINLAAYVGMPICRRFPIEAIQVNKESVEFLASKVSSNQIVIYANTNSGYGLGEYSDGAPVYCTEETPLRPISSYGRTKCAGEKILMQNSNATSFRLATVMGVSRKMRMDLLVNEFTWKAWNDRYIVLFEAHFNRNFIHVRDVATALAMPLTLPKMQGQVYNLGNTSANVSKMGLCLAIKQHLPDFFIAVSEINKDPDQRNYIVSNEKLEALGWEPNFSLDDTIRELLKACPIIKNTNCPFSDI